MFGNHCNLSYFYELTLVSLKSLCWKKSLKTQKERKEKKKKARSQRSYTLQVQSSFSLDRALFLAKPAVWLITYSREAVHAESFSFTFSGRSVAGYFNPKRLAIKEAECIEIQVFIHLESTPACGQQRNTLPSCKEKHYFHVSSQFALDIYKS